MTVYNEEKTIKNQIKSILNQTKLPDEIVILDSLSKDNTAKIIKSFKNKRIKLIEKKADIGTARNICIKKAKNEIILVTDGGCLLDKNWVYEISKPFEDRNVDVVGGIYAPLAKNIFDKCQGMVICKTPEEIDEKKFLPSSRSFAFKKRVWEDAGGYPKHEIGGEDTRFVLNIIERGYKIIITKKAIVYWRMRSLKSFIRQFYLYAKGEVRAGNLAFPQMTLVLIATILFPVYLFTLLLSLILATKIFLIIILISFLYFFYQGIKVALKVNDIRGIYYGFLFSFLKRVMYFSGIWVELLSKKKDTYRNENY
jgi:glycosyltransferase involved in cell wall biosynthesis